jgi:glutamate-5-semialdehyde dehydrogenase
MTTKRLLQAGDWVAIGNNWIQAESSFTSTVEPGDHVLAVVSTTTLKRISREVHDLVKESVGRATAAFGDLAQISDQAINQFFSHAAELLADDTVYAHIRSANETDVASAVSRGRSTTRLTLSDSMRLDMISAFVMWRDLETGRERVLETVNHAGWTVEQITAPLGVVGFVFEGRPNVFADATGVLKSGNTAVFRIGSDALRTAHSLMTHVIRPALTKAGLPLGSVELLDSVEHAAGWALFSDGRLALAVARGSGETVAELGSIAQQSGIPVSLHGTGGAWLLVGSTYNSDHLSSSVEFSLDRKVCNTLNVVCVLESNAHTAVPLIVESARRAANHRGTQPVIRVISGSEKFLNQADVSVIEDLRMLSHECEWENAPEFHIVVVDSLGEAIELFNTHSPQFVVSVISDVDAEHQLVWASSNAPFVGNGFTRWVDGQFALLRPELGLSNWQSGRLFARSAILSGDSAFSVRMRVSQNDFTIHR